MMQITSPSFADGKDIPPRHAREGRNTNPPLEISGVPDGTQSLALIVEDIDSPIGVFTHWVMWNLSPDTTQIEEGIIPANAQVGLNGFGEVGYFGPCPPSGRHRYRFRLLALDTTLEATTPDRKDHIQQEMQGQILDEAFLIGYYEAKV